MQIYRSGHSSSYGECWIEGDGVYFYVCVMNGQSKYGPYTSLADALEEYFKYCA